MAVSSITQIAESGLQEVLSLALKLMQEGYDEPRKLFGDSTLLGIFQRNMSDRRLMVVETAAARLGCRLTRHFWPQGFTLDERQILDEVSGFSQTVDLLLAAYTDDTTFGKGRALMEKLSEVTRASLISIQDDFYAHPAALSHLLGFKTQILELRDKRIAISWAFGQKLSLPRTPHSLLRLAPTLGINVRVVAPRKFQLLNRVFKDVAAHASSLGTEIEQSEDFETAFEDCDAVYASPWTRFDNYLHPERNLEDAHEFKDWYFTEDSLPDGCAFSTDLPIQTELTVSNGLKQKWNSFLQGWFSRRVAVLSALIIYTLKMKEEFPFALI